MTKDQTAGQRIIASAKNALAFARGEENGCIVHIPDAIDVGRMKDGNPGVVSCKLQSVSQRKGEKPD